MSSAAQCYAYNIKTKNFSKAIDIENTKRCPNGVIGHTKWCKEHHSVCVKLYNEYKELCEDIDECVKIVEDIETIKQAEKLLNIFNSKMNKIFICIQKRHLMSSRCIFKNLRDEGHLFFERNLDEMRTVCENVIKKIKDKQEEFRKELQRLDENIERTENVIQQVKIMSSSSSNEKQRVKRQLEILPEKVKQEEKKIRKSALSRLVSEFTAVLNVFLRLGKITHSEAKKTLKDFDIPQSYMTESPVEITKYLYRYHDEKIDYLTAIMFKYLQNILCNEKIVCDNKVDMSHILRLSVEYKKFVNKQTLMLQVSKEYKMIKEYEIKPFTTGHYLSLDSDGNITITNLNKINDFDEVLFFIIEMSVVLNHVLRVLADNNLPLCNMDISNDCMRYIKSM